MLYKYPRKILLYNGMIGMAISLALLSYFNEYKVVLILLSLVFITFFEISIGPIMWLYLAEIMTPRGAGFAYGVNWMSVIILSLFGLFLFGNVERSTVYLIFSSFCALGMLFILLFIKETSGLSTYRCKKLYFPKKKKSQVHVLRRRGSSSDSDSDEIKDTDSLRNLILSDDKSHCTVSDKSNSLVIYTTEDIKLNSN